MEGSLRESSGSIRNVNRTYVLATLNDCWSANNGLRKLLDIYQFQNQVLDMKCTVKEVMTYINLTILFLKKHELVHSVDCALLDDIFKRIVSLREKFNYLIETNSLFRWLASIGLRRRLKRDVSGLFPDVKTFFGLIKDNCKPELERKSKARGESMVQSNSGSFRTKGQQIPISGGNATRRFQDAFTSLPSPMERPETIFTEFHSRPAPSLHNPYGAHQISGGINNNDNISGIKMSGVGIDTVSSGSDIHTPSSGEEVTRLGTEEREERKRKEEEEEEKKKEKEKEEIKRTVMSVNDKIPTPSSEVVHPIGTHHQHQQHPHTSIGTHHHRSAYRSKSHPVELSSDKRGKGGIAYASIGNRIPSAPLRKRGVIIGGVRGSSNKYGSGGSSDSDGSSSDGGEITFGSNNQSSFSIITGDKVISSNIVYSSLSRGTEGDRRVGGRRSGGSGGGSGGGSRLGVRRSVGGGGLTVSRRSVMSPRSAGVYSSSSSRSGIGIGSGGEGGGGVVIYSSLSSGTDDSCGEEYKGMSEDREEEEEEEGECKCGVTLGTLAEKGLSFWGTFKSLDGSMAPFVEWTTFRCKLEDNMGLCLSSQAHDLLIKQVLDVGADGLVHCSRFCEIYASYSPVPTWVPRFTRLYSIPCFIGHASREDAAHLLYHHPPHTLLLRFSESIHASLALNFYLKKGKLDCFRNIAVVCRPNGYFLTPANTTNALHFTRISHLLKYYAYRLKTDSKEDEEEERKREIKDKGGNKCLRMWGEGGEERGNESFMCAPWFHGMVTVEDVAGMGGLLLHEPHGSFLVRFSDTHMGYFVASLVAQMPAQTPHKEEEEEEDDDDDDDHYINVVRHYLIQRNEAGDEWSFCKEEEEEEERNEGEGVVCVIREYGEVFASLPLLVASRPEFKIGVPSPRHTTHTIKQLLSSIHETEKQQGKEKKDDDEEEEEYKGPIVVPLSMVGGEKHPVNYDSFLAPGRTKEDEQMLDDFYSVLSHPTVVDRQAQDNTIPYTLTTKRIDFEYDEMPFSLANSK